MDIKPIETHYKGYRFRSRLEARWAVFFDVLGLKWEYEKEGVELPDETRYLPDFWLPELNCWAEVKPKTPTPEEWEKCRLLSLVTKKLCIVLDTSHPQIYKIYKLASPSKEHYLPYLYAPSEMGVILSMSKAKQRLWLDYLSIDPMTIYSLDITPEIAAKSARFEFGESGV